MKIDQKLTVVIIIIIINEKSFKTSKNLFFFLIKCIIRHAYTPMHGVQINDFLIARAWLLRGAHIFIVKLIFAFFTILIL